MTVSSLSDRPSFSVRVRSLLCHLSTLVWIPLAIGLGSLAASLRVTQLLFLSSLSLVTESGHSADFAILIWLVIDALIAQIICLVLPLVIFVSASNSHPFNHLAARSAFNFLLSLAIYLVIVTAIVAFFDRAANLNSPRNIAWGIPISLGVTVILHSLLSTIAALQSLRGRSFRYPMSLPIIR